MRAKPFPSHVTPMVIINSILSRTFKCLSVCMMGQSRCWHMSQLT